MARYGMVIRTDLCTGCQTCSVACKMENLTLPGCARTKITERIDGSWHVTSCMHCDSPPCVPACPVEATWKDGSGITLVDQDTCIGCKQCIEACPYGARRVNPEKGYFTEPLPFEKAAREAGVAHRLHQTGKIDKCDLCTHRTTKKLPPMCVEACTTGARIFGDLDDPRSEAAILVAKGAAPLKPGLGTKPKVFYLPHG